MILKRFSLETRIAEVKHSMESLQAEIESQKSRRTSVDDEIEVTGRTAFLQSVRPENARRSSTESDDEIDDPVDKVTIQEDPRPTQSTIEPDDQIFDVTITVKSCSFKTKQLQKYKLYIALIGEKAQSSWVDIDAADIKGELQLQTHNRGYL